MQVVDIVGRRIGHVGAIRADCFEVVYEDEAVQNLTQPAIFNVSERVELVCNRESAEKYLCAVHSEPAGSRG